MYEENENKIQWAPILKKVGIILAVILVIFGIVCLVNKCSKNKDTEKPNNTEYSLESQLDELEKATIEYLTPENLPTELNASKTIRLKILVNRTIIKGITDQENTVCDTNESYSEVTRLENNYAVKMTLTCGKNKASRVIYVGCFSNCNGGVCKGEENSTDGVCGGQNETPKEDEKPSENNTNNGIVTPNIKPSTPNNNTTSTVKPNTNNSNNSSNNSTNNNSSVVVNPQKLLYQLKKCSTQRVVCERGNLVNGECLEYGWVTLNDGKVLGGTTSATKPVKATASTKTSTVYVSRPTDVKNTSTVTYKFVGITERGLYEYIKTETTYSCSNKNIKPVNGYCYEPTTTSTPYSCEDKSYSYNSNTGKCEKQEYQLTYASIAGTKEVCETTWSTTPNLPGWTFTGTVR